MVMPFQNVSIDEYDDLTLNCTVLNVPKNSYHEAVWWTHFENVFYKPMKRCPTGR